LHPAIIAVAVLGGVVAIFAVIGVFIVRRRSVLRNLLAPRAAPVSFLITDIEGCHMLWRVYPEAMKAVQASYEQLVRSLAVGNNLYEVSHGGDSFVLAGASTIDCLIAAVELQRSLTKIKWPELDLKRSGGGDKLDMPGELMEDSSGQMVSEDRQWDGPKVSVGIHSCDNDVTVTYDAVRQRYQYSGDGYEAALRIGELACGGQIVFSAETYDALRADGDFDLVLADDIHTQLWCEGAQLHRAKRCDARLIATPFTSLMSCVPQEFSWRAFANCAIGQPPHSLHHHGGLVAVLPTAAEDSNPLAFDSRAAPGATSSSTADPAKAEEISAPSLKSSDGTTSTYHVTASLLLLFAWLGPSQRKQFVGALTSNLMSDSTKQEDGDTRGVVTNFRNPKRLVAAAAKAIKQSDQISRKESTRPLREFEIPVPIRISSTE
jgi:hypothetical protein